MSEALMNYLATQTPEQRTEALAKAAIGRAAAKAEREANMLRLKTEYLDSNHWADLATRYKVRMPMQGVAASPAVIRKYLKLCGLEQEDWDAAYTSRKYFIEQNPLWSAYATAGLILEMKADAEKAQECQKVLTN